MLNKIQNILNKLNEKNINYVILREFEFLINKTEPKSNDLDLFIQKCELNKILKLFPKSKIKNNKLQIYLYENKKIFRIDFHIKTITGFNYSFGIENEIIENKILKQNIYILNNNYKSLSLILRNILSKKKIKKKDINEINIINIIKNYEFFENKLSNIIGNKKTIILLKHLIEKNTKEINKQLLKYKITFIIFSPRNYLNIIKDIFKIIKNRLKKQEFIAITGIDGSGKTTIAKELTKILNENNIKTKYIYLGKGNSNILPIQKIAKKINLKNKSKIKYILGFFIFSIDLFIRYWIKLYPKRRKFLIISDRYSSDLLLSKKVPNFIKIIIYKLFPNPTKIIFLNVPIRILLLRKKEDHINELKRQKKIFDIINLNKKIINIKNINLEKTITKIIEEELL